MNNDENYEKPRMPDRQSELLRELLPKLGLESAEAQKKYRKKFLMRYFVPRLLAVCLAVALFTALGIYLFSPAAFLEVTEQQSPTGCTVDVRLGRKWLVESVMAELNGVPVEARQLEPGAYRVETAANGELVLTATTFAGRVSTESVTVAGIDTQPPHLARDEVIDGRIHIYFEDEEAGVDWQSVRVTDAASGEALDGVETDGEAGFVSFPFPASSARVYLEDGAGNPLTVLLTIPQPGAEKD